MRHYVTKQPSWLVVLLIVLVLGTTQAHADLLVRGYNRSLHNRFDNTAQFIGNPYDWSGLARSNTGRWATMVSDNYFISATHFHPAVGETLTIYGSNNVNGPKQVVNVVGGQQIAGSDVWLGRIDTPTNFGTFEVTAFANPNSYVDHELYVWGLTSNVSEPTAQMKLGRNTVDAFLANFSDPALGAAVTDVVIYDYDTPTGGVGADEARVDSGDSGAPSFMIIMGRPVLVGVHWFKYSGNDFGVISEGSGDSLIARYTNTINAAMLSSGQQLQLITVPEPSTLALFGLPIMAWQIRRRWCSRRAAQGISV